MLLRRFAHAVAIGFATVTSVLAAELPVDLPPVWTPPVVPPIPQWEAELGGRYWYSDGRTTLNLFSSLGSPGPAISRLSYRDLQAHSGEIFTRVEHLNGIFFKGFAGLGTVPGGTLQDQDFPPFIVPFSSTISNQHNGQLGYLTADLGWTWRSDRVKLGAFGGYSYYREKLNAYGCTQTALNPFICVPTIPNSVLLITDDSTWHAARIGLNVEWRFLPGWRLSGDVAWLPYAVMYAADTHWQRPDLGQTAEHGGLFSQVQAEVLLSYQFLNGFSLGAGARYWSFKTASAEGAAADFPTGRSQDITLSTQRWGGFLQASYKFGDLWPTRYNPY